MLNYQHFPAAKPNAMNIVLMHGLFGESGNLVGIAKALNTALDANVIVPDMLSHGASPRANAMTYSTLAQAVEQLIEQLQINNIALIGHSMGGKVAMQLAQRQRFNYLAVIVADIAPVDYALVHNPVIESMLKIEHDFKAGRISQRREADEILAETGEPTAVRQFLLKNLKRDANGMWQWQFGLHEIAASYPALAKAPKLNDDDKPFAPPCLVIKGANSNYILMSHQADFNARFSDISFKVIQGAGHWLHAEKPRLFVSLISQFLLAVQAK